MHMYNFLCSDSLLYTSFFFFLLYIVFIHVIVHDLVFLQVGMIHKDSEWGGGRRRGRRKGEEEGEEGGGKEDDPRVLHRQQ